MEEKKTFNQIQKMHNFESEHKIYCQYCGGHHGVVFYDKKKERLLCPNCKHWIYRDKKTELKYKLKERGISIDN